MSRLTAIFGSDTRGLQRGLAQAQGNVQRFSSNVRSMMLRAFAVTAILAGFRRITNELDNIAKLSRRFGVETGFLQDIALQANLSGASLESVVRGISRLTGELNRAEGPSAAIASEIKALGLELNDLRGLNAEQLFNVIAESIGGLASETDQLTAAQNLMGRSAGELVPLLQDVYEDGLAEAPKHTEAAIRSAEQFNDSWTQAGLTLKTFVSPILVLISGLLQALMETMRGLGNFMGNWISIWTGALGQMWDAAKSRLGLIRDAFASLGKLIRAVLTFDRAAIKEALQSVVEDLKEGLEEVRQVPPVDFDELGRGFRGLWADVKKDGAETGRGIARNFAAAFGRPETIDPTGPTRQRTGTREEAVAAEAVKDSFADAIRSNVNLIEALEKLAQAVSDPSNMAVSSLQRVGGGGIARAGDPNAVKKLQENQLNQLVNINRRIAELIISFRI